MTYKVTYAIDSLDPNPTIEVFDSEYEAIDFLREEVERRIDHIISHSQYSIGESEYYSIAESEYSLARIERID